MTQNEPKFHIGLLLTMTIRRMMTVRREAIRMMVEKMMAKTTMVRIELPGASQLSYPSYVSEIR